MITVNLNNLVRFRIHADDAGLFRDTPGIRIAPPDADGDFPAEAQLFVLIDALSGKLRPWLRPPIHTNIEIVA